MRRPITILLLSLLFFSQVGYRFVYMIQQQLIKEEVEEQILSTINKNQLEQINETENHNAIVWEEEGKEFSLNNQMYDVAKKESSNGNTILYCLNDKKEKQLIEEMIKKVKSGTDNSSSNKDGKQTIKFQVADFTLANNTLIAENSVLVDEKFQDLTVLLHNVSKEVITPPPNKLLSQNKYYETNLQQLSAVTFSSRYLHLCALRLSA